MAELPPERLAFLTALPEQVPLDWLMLLEQEVRPPLRVDEWSRLGDQPVPDVVFVFPDQMPLGSPRAGRVAAELPHARWVAVIPDPDRDAVRQAIAAGYQEVLDLRAVPALALGPVLRAREMRAAEDTAQRLLDESMRAYDDLRWLDRIRSVLRVLETKELVACLVREFADALGEEGGALWRPSEDRGDSGTLVRAWPPPPLGSAAPTMELHAIPRAAELIEGSPAVVPWGDEGQPTAWLPLNDHGMLLALLEVPRRRGASTLLNREEVRVRMLSDWMGIAMRNAIETDRVRKVLRTRFGESFPAQAFRQHVEKAVLQAARYQRPLSLVVLDFEGDADAQRRVFELVVELLRDADICEQPREGRARVFLPETGYLGAVQFVRRVQREVGQKAQRQAALKLRSAIVSFPDHGASVAALLDALDREMERAAEWGPLLRRLQGGWVREFADALAEAPGGTQLNDPNLWADIAFALVHEASLVDPEQSRMLLHLGSYQDSSRTFQPLFEYPGRWDRILATAGLDERAGLPESHSIRLVRDPDVLKTYFAVLDRPSGGVVCWCREHAGDWKGGVLVAAPLARAIINRFEDQYMLHQRWVGG